jgi:hypothetical protein
MAGKLSRRDFLRQVGVYSVGLAALSERDAKKWEAYAKHLPTSRIVYESLACVLQLSKLKNLDSERQARDDDGEPVSVK